MLVGRWTYLVVLERPDGAKLDATNRLAEGGLGVIHEDIEIELTGFSHSSMTLSLRNDDGAVEEFFRDVGPDDQIEVRVTRMVNYLRRAKGQTVFVGVLDLPWSLSYDRKAKTARVEVFSYLKIAENMPATPLERVLALGTATITGGGGSRLVVFSGSTLGLVNGDEIRVVDEALQIEEVKIIDTVRTATDAYALTAWTNSFTAGVVELTTPYPRLIAPADLAAQLITAADGQLRTGNTSFVQPISPEIPVLTPMNIDKLPWSDGSVIRSICDTGDSVGTVQVDPLTVNAAYGTGGVSPGTDEYVGALQDGFTVAVVGVARSRGDWRPYHLTRPANFPTQTASPITDEGHTAWDHANNRAYRMYVDAAISSTLKLERNGVFLVDIDFIAVGSHPWFRLEYDPVNDAVWCSYRRSDASRNVIEVYSVSGGTQTDVTGSSAGQLRFCRHLSVMVWVSEAGTEIRLYNPASPFGLQRSITDTADVIPPSLYLWSLRCFDGVLAACYRTRGRIRIRIWTEAWVALADYDLGPAARNLYVGNDPVVGVTNDATFGECYIVAANGALYGETQSMWVLSRKWAGVIAYADLEDSSLATGFKELALVTQTVLDVDHNKRVSLLSRFVEDAPSVVLGEPLEQTSLPLWENYRTSVEVTGKTESGDEFSSVVGTSPARRLDISSKFAGSGSVGLSVAHSYAAVLGVHRKQEDVSFPMTDQIIRPMKVARFEGRDWVVFGVRADHGEEKVSLVLAEKI